MTGYLRIGGALIMGVLVVLAAFVVSEQNSKKALQAQGGLEAQPNREYVEPTDSDNDGVPDWEEAFVSKVFEEIQSPTTTNTSVSGEYTPPTTFTGKFAEAFFQDYMEGKINGADFSDPTQFVNSAVEAIDSNTQSKTFTPLDITIVPDSENAFREYGNLVIGVVEKYSINNEHEALIVQRAIEANDPRILEDLKPIEDVYKNYVIHTQNIPTPQSLATAHIQLLNTYEAIRFDIAAMQLVFADPLLALARVRTYSDDADALFNALRTISATLRSNGVVYTQEEPGALFYSFGI